MSPKPAARSAAIAVPALTNLMPADEPRARQVEQPVLVLVDEPAALLVDAEILAADEDRRGRRRARRRSRSTASASACSCGAITAGQPALEDAGLLAGDLGERVAEVFGVVVRRPA